MVPASAQSARRNSLAGGRKLFINGKERPVPDPASVRGALDALGLTSHPVAVELNGSLVRRAHQETTVLQPGDRVEIVSFVGGG